MSCFQSAVVSSRTVYPNAVVWSEENLVAVACDAAVIILNPHNPKVRGVITVPSSKRFPTGKIDVDGGGADLLNGCLLPYHLSRETRPCVRSISWSPAGLASNAGCLLAVCTTGGHVKVYRRPHCSPEWVEVVCWSFIPNHLVVEEKRTHSVVEVDESPAGFQYVLKAALCDLISSISFLRAEVVGLESDFVTVKGVAASCSLDGPSCMPRKPASN